MANWYVHVSGKLRERIENIWIGHNEPMIGNNERIIGHNEPTIGWKKIKIVKQKKKIIIIGVNFSLALF